MLHHKVTPLQLEMLRFAGLDSANVDDAEYLSTVAAARDALSKVTGVDFGFEVQAWHDYLLSNNSASYGWGYLAKDLHSRILGMASDERRQRVVASQSNTQQA